MYNEAEKEDAVAKLKENIKIELLTCEPIETPYICKNIGTEEGYGTIEKLILKKIVQEKLTIGESIISIENELNPNSYTD